jgi:hypothetical protein
MAECEAHEVLYDPEDRGAVFNLSQARLAIVDLSN